MDQRQEIAKIELLLEESRAERYRDPQEMVRLAELARDAAERLELSRDAREIADIFARVFAELANAYRLTDRLDLSEEAIGRALGHFERGTRGTKLLALLADRLSSLLCHRRRFPEALDLLDLLFELYRASGEVHLAGRILVKRGLYTDYSGDPEGAVAITIAALKLIDSKSDPSLLLAAVHNLLTSATDLGWFGVVRRLLPIVRPLYGKDRLNLLRLRWIEGRLAAGAGTEEEAERTFEEVRRGFVAEKLLFPASLASLDLALLLLRRGRAPEIIELASELIVSFKALGVGREAVLALILMRRAAEEGRVSAEKLKERILAAREAIRDLERRHA